MTDNVFIGEVIASVDDSTNKKLTVNSQATVQPVALMRLDVFVPSSRPGKGLKSSIDASQVLSNLEFAKREGYDRVKITGERLSMSVDFKVWVGIIHAFSTYGKSSNTITLPFKEFAAMCGFDSKRFDRRLRETFLNSLARIRGKTITFSRGEHLDGMTTTGLLKTASFDARKEKDIVTLEADPRLWELYAADYQVLLRHRPINALSRQEAAQALYTFIESLPSNPAPVSFSRIKDRLSLLSPQFEQNRIIRQALAKLKEINYLDYTIVDKKMRTGKKEPHVMIHSRNPTLKELPV
ncbi:TPA: protein RepA [Salmonella enterica subsp. salamae serovar 35:g,m,s,t:-]|nr:protein RepA [Salmonella enterica subsp. salamae serovar 35:g,m,s,t:-]HCA3549722.1 protein RepA [Salmonella enterica subsp. salamae serovar 35:g,m,s,t:-]